MNDRCLSRGMVCALTGVVCLLTSPAWGDDARPIRKAWTQSRVVGSPEAPPAYKAEIAFPNLKFDHPLLMAAVPETQRLVVGEQDGKIFSFVNEPQAQAELAIDLRKDLTSIGLLPTAKELENLYGFVFHPDFVKNRECFICYTLRGKNNERNLEEGTRVSRFRVTSTNPLKIDPASEEILLTFLQGGHNGGDLHFGPDGYLYITSGDATSPSPPDNLNVSQDITNLLSSVLRIDVNRKDPGLAYAIPKDNPFVGMQIQGKPARGEVWAYGFRNPWRMSFDSLTGDLWLGDVGWELWEMVHKIERGGNYGWSIVEGRQPVNTSMPQGPTPIRPPVIEINHTDGASVTGGYVYRGSRFPELVGQYIFGDWETRRVWAAKFVDGELASLTDLIAPTVRVVSFGQDHAGELYMLDYDAGTVHSFAKNDTPAYDPAQFPTKLSNTGLFASVKEHTPAEGVYPFAINAPQWQDFASSEYLIAIPGDATVMEYAQKKRMPGNVHWHNFHIHFPLGTVLVKTLSLELVRGDPASRQRIETQILHSDGPIWRGYTFAWREDQSDADLVPADGAERDLMVTDPSVLGGKRAQTWTYMSRTQCLQCHNVWSEYSLAFQPGQLNREVATPQGTWNQLHSLGMLGLLQRHDAKDKPIPPAKAHEARPQAKLVNPHDATADLSARARSYLHANCSHCHRFGGGGSVEIELQLDADLAKKCLEAIPKRGTFELPDARVITPGSPERSVLLYRMAKFGNGRMPHLGADCVDEAGCALIAKWIRSLDPGKATATAPKEQPLPENPPVHVALRQALQLNGAAEHRQQVLEAAQKLPPGFARDLFEGYFPRTGPRKLGSNPRPQSILPLVGNLDRGKVLFFSEALKCATCHKVAGQGLEIGPDLTDLASKRTREHILESLLEPSRRVEPQYQSYLLSTVSGETHTGLLVRKENEAVVLKTADNKLITVPAAELESLKPARVSLMPDGQLRDLTPQDAADLLAFLTTPRKGP